MYLEPTTQGIVAVIIGLILFFMGWIKGKQTGVENALDTLIAMRILKITEDGNVVRGDRLDLE